MQITNYYSITELSRLTHKSRPSLYKYALSYSEKKYDDIPYSIIKLFDLIMNQASKQEVINYCNRIFLPHPSDELSEIVDLLNKYKNILDMSKIKKIIEEEIKSGK